jgi:hypothetical protein
VGPAQFVAWSCCQTFCIGWGVSIHHLKSSQLLFQEERCTLSYSVIWKWNCKLRNHIAPVLLLHVMCRRVMEVGSFLEREYIQNGHFSSNLNRLTARVLCWAHCWAWPLATAISRPYPARLLPVGISKRNSNNPRSLEELKHSTEQTVANTDPKHFRKVARKTRKRVDACLRESGGHFQQLLFVLLSKFTNTVVRVEF